MLHARQAAKGIERTFDHWIQILESLARSAVVVNLDDEGLRLMNHMYELHKEDIQGLVRVGPGGDVLAIIPPDDHAVGRNINSFPHFQKAKHTGRPAVSKVLTSPRGFTTVAIHVPVTKNGGFDGVIAVALDFKKLAEVYLSEIRIGKTGYAWMTSREGIELYCPEPGNTGRSVHENHRDSPSLLRMVDNMLAGKQGETTYSLNRIGAHETEDLKKVAVFMPIRIGDTFWSIAVATSEREALAPLSDFRNSLLLLIAALMSGSLLLAYFGATSWRIIREEKKRREAEEARRVSEERLRLALEGADLGTWDWCIPTGTITHNQRWAEMLGYELDEVEQHVRGWESLLHPDEKAQIMEAINSHLRGETELYETEHRLRHKSGGWIWVLGKGKVIERDDNGNPLRACGTHLDITDRKQAEMALAASERSYRLVLENMKEGVVVVQDERIKYANSYALGLFAASMTEVAAAHYLDFTCPDDREMIRERYRRRAQGEKIADRVGYRIQSASGKSIWVEGHASDFIWEGRQASMVFFTDITDRKVAEEEKQKLQIQLYQSQKMEAVGILAGGIAHDFNNLLQAIQGYTEIMLLNISEKDPKRHNLKAIYQASERAAQLVRQLLLFSRKVETAKKPVELNQEIDQAIRILERTLPKMIDIELHLASRPWTINADPVQMEQILLNLGTNAADAMPEGGKLIIETANVTLAADQAPNHSGVTPGRYVLLVVSDTGHGMDKETVEHVFEPFFTTKEIGKGTGLGLASVYGIVKSHGGYIECHSEIGLGTTFKIYLPALERMDADEAKAIADSPPKGGTETILLVDDDNSVREFAAQALQSLGYKVLMAASGERALEVYSNKSHKIDLVIIDIGMPGMGGHKCIQEILGMDTSAKILIASGYPIDGQVKKSLEGGAKGYIGKPYHLADLLHEVRSVLDEKE
ncbi:MAG: PAS domain S-box protein [Thermodesulfobacteriota bacterium]